jgi:hypothetical protein
MLPIAEVGAKPSLINRKREPAGQPAQSYAYPPAQSDNVDL